MTTTTKKGLLAGVIMSLLLFPLSIMGDFGGSILKFGKYIALAIILGTFLFRLSQEKNRFYKYAIGRGARISLIAAIVISMINIILFIINPSYSVSKYRLSPETFGGLMAVNGSLIFEVMVVGMILTFIFFQLFKNSNPVEYK